jgi:hypothetical protein
VERLPRIVDVCLRRPMAAFSGRPVTALVDPARIRPDVLADLVRDTGPSLFTSPQLVWDECLRLLAHSGYRAATEPERATELARDFEQWMLRLGHGSQLAA